jgi:Cu/Ag efflux protein CusF
MISIGISDTTSVDGDNRCGADQKRDQHGRRSEKQNSPLEFPAARSEYRVLSIISTHGVPITEQICPLRLIPDCSKAGRISMRQAKTVLAGCIFTVISSVALAQQPLTGTVTTVDRINGTIAIQQTQSGTVGASTGGATEQFRVQGGLLNTLHAGDKVTFSVSESGGTKTIMSLEKQ